jgi:hypothetical protein
MNKNKVKITLSLAALVLVVLGYFFFIQFIKPETVIKDDIAATQDLFRVIDIQMKSNGHNAYMSLEPTGHVSNLVNVVNTVAMPDNLPPINTSTAEYYLDYAQNPDSQISIRYSINFDQSKVDNVYLIRKIDHNDYFGFNEHATLSHIIFTLNKSHNIKPSTSLRLELAPIKMKNGEAYHYFAKQDDINTPVAYDTCKDTLDCLYISRYKSTVPRPL